MNVEVEVVKVVTDEVVDAFGRLIPQLSQSGAGRTDPAWARGLVGQPGARGPDQWRDRRHADPSDVPIPTGLRAWIEDVVVDAGARGHGVGAALTNEAVRLARADGARTVDLTSRPSRQAANRLYERLGVRAARLEDLPPHRRLVYLAALLLQTNWQTAGVIAHNLAALLSAVVTEVNHRRLREQLQQSPEPHPGQPLRGWLSTTPSWSGGNCLPAWRRSVVGVVCIEQAGEPLRTEAVGQLP